MLSQCWIRTLFRSHVHGLLLDCKNDWSVELNHPGKSENESHHVPYWWGGVPQRDSVRGGGG